MNMRKGDRRAVTFLSCVIFFILSIRRLRRKRQTCVRSPRPTFSPPGFGPPPSARGAERTTFVLMARRHHFGFAKNDKVAFGGLVRPAHQNKGHCNAVPFVLVGAGGFGPPKSVTTDLQSAPFGRSGTLPYGAGDRSRTNNLLITNQLLCH